ncbi:MAG: phospholipase [Acidimicrobiaceae bacterium]
MRGFSRRQFLAGAGIGAAGLATGGFGSLANAALAKPTAAPRLPSPTSSGIDHIVVLCMENRSFDHFLGWVPKANGKQSGLTYCDNDGNPHATHHLTEWQGCGFNDPDHGYGGGRIQLNGGKCDGFRKGDNDDFALGYYTRGDLPTTAALVDNFTIFDSWFCGILGPTYPNRFYTHAAATDRISNTMDTSTLPTIWDRLSSAGVPANYYFSDLPFIGLFGQRMLPFCRRIENFYLDAAAGTLPAYSYLDPYFLGEGQGGSNDDHPHADIRRGQAFVGQVVSALMQSPLWSRTLLFVTYDEWGGFFDHVRPPTLPDLFVPTESEEHNTAGFRVPTYLVSPFAPKGRVAHDQFDHSSILKLVEWRFGLESLTPRDRAARNPAAVLDFSRPNLVPPAMPVVMDPGPHLCGSPDIGMAADDVMWQELAALPIMRSFEAVA